MKSKCLIISLLLCHCLQGQIISTFAGNGTAGFSGEGGPAINAEFEYMAGIVTDKIGNIYVASWADNVIQKIDTNGVLTRFAGNGLPGYSGDGGPATAAKLDLYLSVGLASDTAGDIYISCAQTIRKVDKYGIITTIAGNGLYGYSGDGGPATAAQFKATSGICFDKFGNLYIADEQNSNIRKINTSGIISTFAGTTIGFSGDGGPATAAQLKEPTGLAFDDSGNFYIADGVNNRVRKIDTSGFIYTIAGGDATGVEFCFGCSAMHLKLGGLVGLTVDMSGNVYASAISDDAVHKITKDGKAYTIAGTGVTGYSGDGGPASVAMLNSPSMICFDIAGNLLISDKGNHRYRKVWMSTTSAPTYPHIKPPSFSVYPNPVTQHKVTCFITADTNEEATLVVKNILGQQVFSASCTTNTATDFNINVPAGIYFVTATTLRYQFKKKIVIE